MPQQPTLSELLTQAVTDTNNYNAAAATVVADQKLLTADQQAAATAGDIARASVGAGIKALTDVLGGLPAGAPVPTPAPTSVALAL